MECNITYTRADAIEDGFLIDVSKMAKEAGIKYPIALTSALYAKIEDKPELEDIDGRTWDILSMLKFAITGVISSKKIGEDLIYYDLILNDSRDTLEKEITLKALVHSGDTGEPVITIMLPEED